MLTNEDSSLKTPKRFLYRNVPVYTADIRLKRINRVANIGFGLYVVAFIVSLLSGLAGVVLVLLLSVYFGMVAVLTGKR